ncbi:MAG: rod shape-determining protein MreC [Clostridiales bacterium]|nr:rod shape-determining protein MreC [Clostridiales bacterium]MCD7753902.1 rod shape-determining protein MreC [Clostridiales bacterium]MCD7880114.1 rod shape-determining protein MreC [Clostridiales bacterium]
MRKFLQKNGFAVLIVALLLTAAVSITTALMPVDPLTNLAGILATPFRAVATAVTSWAEGVWDYATEYEALKEENEALRLQVAQLEEENREATEALEENERLRALLELREKRSDFVFESATVTGRSVTSWSATLTISKGAAQGIEEGDCVITEAGYLVGVVGEAGTNWSTVVTVIDPDISMGALVFSTGEDGLLEGDLTLMLEGACRLSYLSTDSAIAVGDEVLTSGLGGVYPSGLMIGTVERVETTSSGVELYAVLRPSADLEALEEVFVIKEFDIVE